MLFEEFMEKAVKEFYSLTKDYERTYNLLKICRSHKYYYFGYFVGKLLENTDNPIYLDELAICAYWIGNYEEAQLLNRKVLCLCPEDMKERVRKNISFCEQKLKK